MTAIARAAVAALLFALAGAAMAAPPMPPTKYTMEACMFAALKEFPGRVLGMEFGTDNSTPVYEFDVLGSNGRTAEIECSAETGLIVETAFEKGELDLVAFLRKARITDHDAVRIALKEVPGNVVAIEHEMAQDGSIYYEVKIRTAHTEREVEVNAATGQISEVETLIYRIGED